MSPIAASTNTTERYATSIALPRLPAGELERAVIDQLRRVLRAPDLIAEIVPKAVELDASLDEAQVTVAMTQVEQVWEQLFPAEQQRLVRLLVEKVTVSPDRLEIRMYPVGIQTLANECRTPVEGIAA